MAVDFRRSMIRWRTAAAAWSLTLAIGFATAAAAGLHRLFDLFRADSYIP